jgi:hypothetical protein
MKNFPLDLLIEHRTFRRPRTHFVALIHNGTQLLLLNRFYRNRSHRPKLAYIFAAHIALLQDFSEN